MSPFLYFLVGCAVLGNILGGWHYIRATLAGKTKPNRVTWFLWAVIPMISVVATLSTGFSWAVVPVFMAGFIPICVLIASFVNPQAEWKLQNLDYACGFISVLAIVLWLLTANPLLAVILAMIADTLAAAPTLVKSYYNPETESIGPFMAGIFGGSVGLLVTTNFVPIEYLFPLYLIVLNSTLVCLIKRPKFTS